MKLLVLLAVLLFAVWLWRRGRSAAQADAQPLWTPPAEVAPMDHCLHCQVHFPFDEGIQGLLGTYCSHDHRSAAGDRAPAP